MPRLRSILADIRVWIFLVLLLRLWGIADPPLESTHGWRQAFTNIVARNMAEDGIDLLYPRTDLAGERPDVVASEFPGFNAIIAIIQRMCGPAHWYGRLIALLVSSAGAWAFAALVRRRYGRRVAFIATFVLLWSSWFVYGRKSMPDTFSISLMLLALYAIERTVSDRRPLWLVPAVALAAVGGMCKIPATVLLVPWGLCVLMPGLEPRLRILLSLALASAIAPVVWWYFHWQPHLLQTYGNPLYFPFDLAEGWHGLVQLKWKLLERFRFSALLSHVAFVAALAGMWLTLRSRDRATTLCAVGIAVPFFYFMLKAGSVFPLHAYYILPLVPLLALLAGVGLAAIQDNRWLVVVLLAVVVEATGIRWSDLNAGNERAYMLRAEGLADRFTMQDDLVACNTELDPRPMYFLHRHGWNIGSGSAPAMSIDSLRTLGLRAVFVDRHMSDDHLSWKLLYEDADWRVYGPPQPELP